MGKVRQGRREANRSVCYGGCCYGYRGPDSSGTFLEGHTCLSGLLPEEREVGQLSTVPLR